MVDWPGVQVPFIHNRPPLEHSQIERHHQTIAGQAFEGQIFVDVTALQTSLQARILFLDLEHPTLALDGQVPLQAFPQARHSGRIYSLAAEEQMLEMQCIYDYLQCGCWFRQVSSLGIFSLGGYSYNVTTQIAEQIVEIAFDGPTSRLICLPEKSTVTFLFDIRGLTKSALMGNALVLPVYTVCQMALSFAYPDTTL